MSKNPILIIGSGLSAKMAAINLLEQDQPVMMVSRHHLHQADSANDFSGCLKINHPEKYLEDTLKASDGLGDEKFYQTVIHDHQKIIDFLISLNIPFIENEYDQVLEFSSLGFNSNPQIFSSINTSTYLNRALADYLEKYQRSGKLVFHHGLEIIDFIIDDDQMIRGVIAQHEITMEIKNYLANVIIVASGGMGKIFGATSQSHHSYGNVSSLLYRHGHALANLEFIHYSPFCIFNQNRIIDLESSFLLNQSRVWTYQDGEPWYFLEEFSFAGYQKLPSIVISRYLHKIIEEKNLGVKGNPYVYLDLTKNLNSSNQLNDFKKFCIHQLNIDPSKNPLPIHIAPSYFLGGIYTDENGQTESPNIFSCGEASYYGHGASLLNGNRLIFSLMTGLKASHQALKYSQNKKNFKNLSNHLLEIHLYKQHQKNNRFLEKKGDENPYEIYSELTTWMKKYLGIIRDNKELELFLEKIAELKLRFENIYLSDRGKWSNQNLFFVRSLELGLDLAEAITKSALHRDESRGCHYKPEYPHRNDQSYKKNTLVYYTPMGAKIDWENK